MKLLFLILFPIFSFAQLHSQFGFSIGKTIYNKSCYKEYTVPEWNNERYVTEYKYLSSPVLGLHTNFCNKLLYLGMGVEYNYIKSYFACKRTKYFYHGQPEQLYNYSYNEYNKSKLHKLNFPNRGYRDDIHSCQRTLLFRQRKITV